MAPSRRDFLRRTGCVLGSAALASTIENFGLISAFAQEGTPASDYKALVCVFMNGGNDANNMIVPLDAEYAAYNTTRNAAGLAIPQANLLPINPASGRQFGFHPSMAEMQTLFTQQKLGVLCNVGPLVEPLTRATYRSGGRRPAQLFSHSDQVNQWLNAYALGPLQTGWGGRIADKTAGLNGAATFPQVLSISGVNLFVTGGFTRPLAIGDSRTALNRLLPLNNAPGATANENSTRRASFDQLRGVDLGTTLVKASRDTIEQAIQTSTALAMADATLTTAFPDTSLGFQLEQVARLIKVRDNPALNVKRQIFFVSLGGFDTHNNQGNATGPQADLLRQVSQAMKAFYDATVELGVQNQVTTFTLSDFGRTFQPAGAGGAVGTDHGWGNHQLMMGGAVLGGTFYGQFPTLALGGPNDTDSRGRWIPTTSVEQYAATLATWYGLSNTDLPYVFPLIGRFSSSNLGFLT